MSIFNIFSNLVSIVNNIISKQNIERKQYLDFQPTDYLRFMNRFVVLNVPMNCGKTYTIADLCEHETNSNKGIVSITHRKALAITLGDKYGCISYTDLFFDDVNFDVYKRVSITSNSLCKISSKLNYEYSILIIDQVDWFRLNMISKTMKTCWGNFLLKLEIIIKSTSTVIIMQDILTENDVPFTLN